MKKRKNTKKRRIIVLRIKITLFFLALLAAAILGFHRELIGRAWEKAVSVMITVKENVFPDRTEPPVIPEEEEEKEPGKENETETEKEEIKEEPEKVVTLSDLDLKEEEIYTFMQGPKAWNSKTPWSGEWCEKALAGTKFSVFGCGLCNLANIYSTLSPYECSPLDMYEYALEVSGYSPGGGVGAIDWPYMEETLNHTGFGCSLGNKDDTYEEFCERISEAMTAIVLVSTANDSTYWKDTSGHYVNIWDYDRETDQVFLADSGDPEHNRSRIPLKYVYDALKTSGTYQYLLVHSYTESKNTWKYSGIKEDWTIPDYYISKSESK